MSAEEFYKEYFNKAWHMVDEEDRRTERFDWYDLIDFARAYNEKMKK